MVQKLADNETPRKKPARQKPPIWSDGRQAPRFEFDAFLKASTANARRLAARVLAASADSVRRGAASFRDGSWRLPPERLGRTGRYLPDHMAMARTFSATARLTAAAGSWALGPQAVEALPFRGWDAEEPANEPAPPSPTSPLRYVRPPRSATAAPAIEVDQETLSAIRSVVHAANVMPIRPVRAAAPEPEPVPEPEEPRSARLPDLAPAEPSAPRLPFRAGIALIGGVALAAAWPAGAVQAVMAHLRGEDLRAQL